MSPLNVTLQPNEKIEEVIRDAEIAIRKLEIDTKEIGYKKHLFKRIKAQSVLRNNQKNVKSDDVRSFIKNAREI